MNQKNNSNRAALETLIKSICHAPDIDALTRLDHDIADLPSQLSERNTPVFDMLEQLSTVYTALTCRVLELTEKEMVRRDGPVPAPFCWINMGSAARREQVLRTDQDNALIWADVPDEKKSRCRDYFKKMADEVNTGLHQCGFALCPGNVMASNPKWRGSLSSWQDKVVRWFDSFDPQDTRDLTIFLDFRPVYGDTTLADPVHDTLEERFSASDQTSHMLMTDEIQSAPPVTLTGQIRTRRSGRYRDQINIKTSAQVHIINGVRLYSVNHGIRAASTLDRLAAISEKQILPPEMVRHLEEAMEILVRLRLKANLRQIHYHQEPDDYLFPAKLTPEEHSGLVHALKVIGPLQKQIQEDYRITWLNFFS